MKNEREGIDQSETNTGMADLPSPSWVKYLPYAILAVLCALSLLSRIILLLR
jgi:hypothetical protein